MTQKSFLFLLMLSTLLAGCSLFENDSDSTITFLPEVNHSLNSDTAEGIWMIEIDTSESASYYHENDSDRSDDFDIHRSDYGVVRIRESEENPNTVLIESCSPDSRTFSKSWTKSGSSFVPTEDIIVDGLEDSYIFQTYIIGTLEFDNNLSFQGSSTFEFKASPIGHIGFFEDIYSAIFPKTQEADIKFKAVKVSDELDFSQATELDLIIDLSNSLSPIQSTDKSTTCINAQNNKIISTTIVDNVPKASTSSERSVFSILYENATQLSFHETSQEDSQIYYRVHDTTSDETKITKYTTRECSTNSCNQLDYYSHSIHISEGKLEVSTHFSLNNTIETTSISVSTRY